MNNSSNTLLVHSVICIVALAAAGVGCNLLNLPVAATEGICSLVALVLVATGMMTAASSASTKAIAQTLADDAREAIAALEIQHAEHSAQIAALKVQTITISTPSIEVAPVANVDAAQPVTVASPPHRSELASK